MKLMAQFSVATNKIIKTFKQLKTILVTSRDRSKVSKEQDRGRRYMQDNSSLGFQRRVVY